MEHHRRTLLKTVTWRFIAMLTTITVVYLYRNDVQEALTIGVSANAVKMVLYYIHERIWNRVEFGRAKRPGYQN